MTPEDADPPARRARSITTIVAVLVFGLLVAIAAVQTSRNSSVANEGREQLIKRINERHANVAALQKQISELRAATTQWERYAAGMAGVLSAAPLPT